MANSVLAENDIQSDIQAIANIPIIPSLLEVICSTTGMGFAAVARVTESKWVACGVRDEINFGLKPGSELELETTICHEIRQSREEVVIDHVANDPHFCNHHTPKIYGFQSYISIPIIRKNGDFFGTLCAIDPRPARLNNAKTIGMFKLFADLISYHLENVERLAFSESELKEERSMTELREHFIAILGHDLRNPVSAISNSAQLQMRITTDEDLLQLAAIIKNSAFRMQGLIENMLDLARGRMAGGIPVSVKSEHSLEEVLKEVVAELQSVWPNQVIETNFAIAGPVNCDSGRIAQLFSNILGNAITYGEDDKPVKVAATIEKGAFILKVTNAGKEIPAAVRRRIFQPFTRGDVTPGKQGLGLGLYIAGEIAKAHSGTLEVDSSPLETRFTLTIPCL
jgi:signal transduction histidine kinase